MEPCAMLLTSPVSQTNSNNCTGSSGSQQRKVSQGEHITHVHPRSFLRRLHSFALPPPVTLGSSISVASGRFCLTCLKQERQSVIRCDTVRRKTVG